MEGEGEVRVTLPWMAKPFTIYRVPEYIRDSAEKKYYEPKVLSIGPYHHKMKHLRAMEERKQVYLQRFLDASKPTTRQDYEARISAIAEEASRCYFESPVPELMTPKEFKKMLLVDGCFILQFIIEWFIRIPRDPLLKVGWMLPLLHNDLLLLDNQIPYPVLRSLYDVYCEDTGPEEPPKMALMPMIAHYFKEALSPKMALMPMTSVHASHEDRMDHLLHLFHCHFITPPLVQGNGEAPGTSSIYTVPCASELMLHGVVFKPTSDDRANIIDVTFREGIFQIPLVVIEEGDCSRYMNLVAFEMSHHEVHKHLTSYVLLMDYLIDTPEDVRILKEHGILKSLMPSNEEVCDFFNRVGHCCYVDFESHYLWRVYQDVDQYCKRKCPKNMATLRRNYLSNPWAVVAFFFGLLFACFTIFSTVISIMQTFFHFPKP